MPAFQRYSDNLPALWLFTDARSADTLDRDIAALPPASGVVFRHYHLSEAQRRQLFAELMRRHAGDHHLWLWSGAAKTARAVNADGCYGPAHGPQPGLQSQRHGLWFAAVHNLAELAMASRRGADAVFLSPAYPTRTHPRGNALGVMRFAALARRAACPVYALGGVTPHNFARLDRFSQGWGAIDGLSESQ